MGLIFGSTYNVLVWLVSQSLQLQTSKYRYQEIISFFPTTPHYSLQKYLVLWITFTKHINNRRKRMETPDFILVRKSQQF